MKIADTILPEVDIEFTNLRVAVSRAPEDQLDWRPHERSWTLRELLTHLVNLPNWGTMTLEQDHYDLDPSYREEPVASLEEALQRLDEGFGSMRTALAAASDDAMVAPWAFKKDGEVLFEMPRMAVLRSMILNHMVHHRGQLTVYLRQVGAKVPSIYGPSADEGQG